MKRRNLFTYFLITIFGLFPINIYTVVHAAPYMSYKAPVVMPVVLTGSAGVPLKIGNTAFINWDNSIPGNNIPNVISVSMDLSQIGGGINVPMGHYNQNYAYSFLLSPNPIDTSAAHVVLTAVDSDGRSYQLSSNSVPVDLEVPRVSQENIYISGGTGPGGSFRIGDIVHVSWDNTAPSDNNFDIANVRADISELGEPSNLPMTPSTGIYYSSSAQLTEQSIQRDNAKVTILVTDDAGYVVSRNTPSNIAVDLLPAALQAAQSFTSETVAAELQTDLTITINNPNQISTGGINFIVILPFSLSVTVANAIQCGGSVDISNPTQITFTGGTLSADDNSPGGPDTCDIITSIQTTQVGSYTLDAFQVHATGRPDGTSNSASIEVLFPAPVLIGPVDGSTWHGWIPTLSWSAIDGAISYHLIIDHDPGFSNPEVDESLAGLSYTITDDLPVGIWYWKVQANQDTIQGFWSNPWSFVFADPYMTFFAILLHGN